MVRSSSTRESAALKYIALRTFEATSRAAVDDSNAPPCLSPRPLIRFPPARRAPQMAMMMMMTMM
eukprot:3364143-Karenia_brevis.AAC.2